MSHYPKKKISQVDISMVPENMIEMIRDGFHCKDDNELDYFVRRFVAA